MCLIVSNVIIFNKLLKFHVYKILNNSEDSYNSPDGVRVYGHCKTAVDLRVNFSSISIDTIR